MELQITLIPGATCPTRGSKWSAGLDLSAYLPEGPVFLRPGERSLIRTGVTLAIPHGFYGRIAPRSGLALRHGIDVMAGVIDSDYRGEVQVMLINHDGVDSVGNFVATHGDRIAQLIIEQVGMFDPKIVTELSETKRGDNGYGSTGLKKNNELSGQVDLEAYLDAKAHNEAIVG